MERVTRVRAGALVTMLCLVIAFFAIRLYAMQVVQTGGNTNNTTTYTTLTRVKAARGELLDCNGNVLVTNRASYDLVFNHYVILSCDNPNEELYKLTQLCKQQGISYTEHFPVSRTAPFEYTLEDLNASWQNNFQLYLQHRGNMDSDVTASLLMRKLRKDYKIPEEWSDEDARLVIGLRFELALRNGITNLSNYVLIEDVSEEALAAILELNIPGLSVESSTVRAYNTRYAAHILGYVGRMSSDQWETYKDKGYSMDAMVGQTGLEAAYEEYLHGTDGWRLDKVTKDGTVVESYYTVEPKSGQNVMLSVDLNLQITAEDALAEKIQDLKLHGANDDDNGKDVEGAAAVVLNVKTGEVLACASYPTFNLATFFEDYEENMANPLRPTSNRALQAIYPPGSTYKMSMTIAGIESGTIDSRTHIRDEGLFTKYPGFSAACLIWTLDHKTHGSIDVTDALKVSCNYFFYVLGDSVPIEYIDSTAKGLGLGESTGVELYEEVGYRANPETKAKLYTGQDARWYRGDQILGAIGQSENRFTPMQLAVYASTLANRGTRYKVTFLNRVVSSDYSTLITQNSPQILSTMEISDEAYRAYTEGMAKVARDRQGSVYWAFGDYPVQVAAKTGTAQTGQTGSDNGAFICYAPADDPEIAVAVYGEKGGHGSAMCYVAKAILDVYFGVDGTGEVNSMENQIG